MTQARKTYESYEGEDPMEHMLDLAGYIYWRLTRGGED